LLMAVVCFSKSLVPFLGKVPNILGSSFIPNQANHQQIDTSQFAVNGNVKICELSKLSFNHAENRKPDFFKCQLR